MRRLVGVGLTALVVSAFLPAVSVGGNQVSGVELVRRVPVLALEQLGAPSSARSAALAMLTLIALSSNVIVPVLALYPGGWRRVVATTLALIDLGLMLYLTFASPLHFLLGGVLWWIGIASLAAAAWL